MNIFHELFRQFASVSRLHIIGIAALGTLTFGWAFTGNYLWIPVGLCALDWFLVNLLNRVVDLKEDKANGITATSFVEKYQKVILWGGLSLLGGSLVATGLVWWELTMFRLAYHALGIVYNWRLLPRRRRLKEVYFWKNTSSAIGFLLTVFIYPLVYAGWLHGGVEFPPGITSYSPIFVLSFFLLFEVSYEVIYDLRDVEGDKLAGVKTYPVVHGAEVSMKIIDGLLVVSALSLCIGYIAGHVPWRLFVMILAPILQFGIYKRAVRKHGRVRAVDCIFITWLGAGLLAAYHVWVFLELPGIGL